MTLRDEQHEWLSAQTDKPVDREVLLTVQETRQTPIDACTVCSAMWRVVIVTAAWMRMAQTALPLRKYLYFSDEAPHYLRYTSES
jgi:hypothetical protein